MSQTFECWEGRERWMPGARWPASQVKSVSSSSQSEILSPNLEDSH